MHCTSCGTPLVEGAVFCKRCGTALMTRGSSSTPSDKLAELSIVFCVTMGVVGLGGLIAVLVLANKLFNRGVESPQVVFLTLAGLCAVFGLTMLLARQASRVLDAYLHPFGRKEAHAPELAPRDTAQLEAPREPVSSVTDHTTRTFDPIHVENSRRQ